MIKVGCDPEFFLKDAKGNNVSAHNLVPGTKQAPHKLDKGAIQADGTAVEFNIDPAETSEEFASNIETVLKQVRDIVPKELEFDFSPTVTYPKAYFDTIPESAKELGCEPDFNAWREGEMNPRPKPEEGFRTASGHLHIGWTEKADVSSDGHLLDCMLVTRRMDYLLHPITPAWEERADDARRGLYGDWGTFRPKPYGVEYRVLGNTWLRYPKLWPYLFDLSTYVFKTLEAGYGENKLAYMPLVIDHSQPNGHQNLGEHGTVYPGFMVPAFGRGHPSVRTADYLSTFNEDMKYLCSTFKSVKNYPKLNASMFK